MNIFNPQIDKYVYIQTSRFMNDIPTPYLRVLVK